jgi:hypothetical protein
MLEIRGKHGFTPKYTDVQAPTAAMNIHRHSRCHYKRNSGSTPAGTNNPHIKRHVGRQTPGGSPATSAAAAMALGRTLPLEGSRSCPLAGDENQPLKPKSRRPGAQVTPTISSAEKPSSAATTSAPTASPPAHQHRTSERQPPQSAPAGPHSRPRHENVNGTVPEHEYRPRGVRRVVRPSGAAGHSRPDRGRNDAPWPGSSSSPSPAWLEDASSAELEDGFHPQILEEEAGHEPTRRQTPARLAPRPSKDDEDP